MYEPGSGRVKRLGNLRLSSLISADDYFLQRIDLLLLMQ